MKRIPVFVLTVLAASGIATAARAQAPTFSKDVAPILYNNCVVCHRPGEVAPMSLLTYQNVRPWARAIKNKVVNHEMPPWGAGPGSMKLANDRSLSQKDIDTIVRWADTGAPKARTRICRPRRRSPPAAGHSASRMQSSICPSKLRCRRPASFHRCRTS